MFLWILAPCQKRVLWFCVVIWAVLKIHWNPTWPKEWTSIKVGFLLGYHEGACTVCNIIYSPYMHIILYIHRPGSSRYVRFLPFGRFFWWKGRNFTHLEDPGMMCMISSPPKLPNQQHHRFRKRVQWVDNQPRERCPEKHTQMSWKCWACWVFEFVGFVEFVVFFRRCWLPSELTVRPVTWLVGCCLKVAPCRPFATFFLSDLEVHHARGYEKVLSQVQMEQFEKLFKHWECDFWIYSHDGCVYIYTYLYIRPFSVDSCINVVFSWGIVVSYMICIFLMSSYLRILMYLFHINGCFWFP